MTGFGWLPGEPKDFDREYAVDLAQLTAFLQATQKETAAALHLGSDAPERRKVLARVQAEITSRGVIDVLRHGIRHGKHDVTFFYQTPSPGNEKAAAFCRQNRFSVTRQLRYSRDETKRALDLCLFIKRIFTPGGFTKVIESYAQIAEETNPKTRRKKEKQVFPRFHQLEVVRRLLADVAWACVGKRYLIQHSAGSGKSNSIAWLAHQLIGLRKDGKEIFDSIIVVTDRRILDQQIHATIKQFVQVSATVGHAKNAGDLRKFIESGKKIIITTVQNGVSRPSL